MSKIVATIAVLMFAFAATASAQVLQLHRSPEVRPANVAQDFRSPDARPASAAQDYRSPDARPSAPSSTVAAHDFRSPDARPGGHFIPSQPATTSQASGSFQWGYLAVGIAMALVALGVVLITQRRRRHGLAIGS